VCTSGTAVANLHPAVLEAHHSGVPLIVLTADRPAELRGIGSNQTTVQPGIFGELVRADWDVPAPTGAPGEREDARTLAALLPPGRVERVMRELRLMFPDAEDPVDAVSANYVADRSLATVLYLALKMQRPLFLEGEAGVGKTEIAKVLAAGLNRKLIRLQCYEGLDVSTAVYEWNYPRQMVEIRLAEVTGDQCKQIGRLLERVLPNRVMAIPGKLTAFDFVAV
jgi:hypothetical protein